MNIAIFTHWVTLQLFQSGGNEFLMLYPLYRCLFFVANGFMALGEFTNVRCLRPYHLEYTSSRPITEVKQG